MRNLCIFSAFILFSSSAFAHGDIDAVYTLGAQAVLVIAFTMYLVLKGTKRQKLTSGIIFYGVSVVTFLIASVLPYSQNKNLITFLSIGAPVLAWLYSFIFVMRGSRDNVS